LIVHSRASRARQIWQDAVHVSVLGDFGSAVVDRHDKRLQGSRGARWGRAVGLESL